MLGQALGSFIFLLIPSLLRRAWQGPSKPLFLLFRFPGAWQNGNRTQASSLDQRPPFPSELPSRPCFGSDTMLVWGWSSICFYHRVESWKIDEIELTPKWTWFCCFPENVSSVGGGGMSKALGMPLTMVLWACSSMTPFGDHLLYKLYALDSRLETIATQRSLNKPDKTTSS